MRLSSWGIPGSKEIMDTFPDHLQHIQKIRGFQSADAVMVALDHSFNGYSFGVDSKANKISDPVFNPIDINTALSKGVVSGGFWTDTGSSRSLLKLLDNMGDDSRCSSRAHHDQSRAVPTCRCAESNDADAINWIPDHEVHQQRQHHLGTQPNREVQRSLSNAAVAK